MQPEAETEMVGGVALEVEPVGIGEDARVSVGGRLDQVDHVVPADHLIAHVDVGGGHAHLHLRRAVEAQDLLSGGSQVLGVVVRAQPLQLVRMRQQGMQPVADQIGRGLVAAEQQQDAGAHDLVVGERVVALLGADERVNQVLRRRGPEAADETAEVFRQLQQPALGPLAPPLDTAGAEHQHHQVVGPVLEQVPIGRGHTHHLGDHDRRQRVGEVGDHVHVAARRQLGDETVDDLDDAGLPLRDRPRRERPADQLAQARVVGGIAEHHPLAEDPVRGGALGAL